MSLKGQALTQAVGEGIVRSRHKNLQDTYPGVLPDFDDLPPDVQALARDRLLYDADTVLDGTFRKAPPSATVDDYKER